MKTVEVRVRITWDDKIMYSATDTDAKEWFVFDVLGGELQLLSDEVGDVVATAVVANHDELWEAVENA